jgi:hypothetical protein
MQMGLAAYLRINLICEAMATDAQPQGSRAPSVLQQFTNGNANEGMKAAFGDDFLGCQFSILARL